MPRPHLNLTRFHGIFAPYFKHRKRIVPHRPRDTVDRAKPVAPMTWAQRLKRVFAIDIETCIETGSDTILSILEFQSLAGRCSKPLAIWLTFVRKMFNRIDNLSRNFLHDQPHTSSKTRAHSPRRSSISRAISDGSSGSSAPAWRSFRACFPTPLLQRLVGPPRRDGSRKIALSQQSSVQVLRLDTDS